MRLLLLVLLLSNLAQAQSYVRQNRNVYVKNAGDVFFPPDQGSDSASIPPPTTFDYYIDSDAPPGGNGLTPETAFNDLSDITWQNSKTYAIKRGSCFRQQIYCPLIDSSILTTYGSGNRPIFDCAAIADNNNMTKRYGYTNVYALPWATLNDDGSAQHSVWEDQQRLRRAVSMVACDTTPGSYYAPTVTRDGVDTVFIHPAESDTTGKMFELAYLDRGIYVGDNWRVYNMHTKRNLANDGSIQSSRNSYLYNILAEDGVKHNLFMESGLAEYCTAWKADIPVVFGGATMFISYSNGTGTISVTYKNCNIIGAFNDLPLTNTGMIGFYTHKGGTVSYTNTVIDGGYYTGVNSIFSGELGTGITIKNVYANAFTRFLDCTTIIGNITVDSCEIVSNQQYLVTARGGNYTFRQNKISFTGGTGGSSYVVRRSTDSTATFVFQNNTVTTDQTLAGLYWDLDNELRAVTMTGNIVAGVTTARPISAGSVTDTAAAMALVTGSNNHYAASTVYSIGGSSISIVREAGSVTTFNRSSFTGSFTTGDYFLSTGHAAYGVAGSISTFDGILRYPQSVIDLIDDWWNIPVCD